MSWISVKDRLPKDNEYVLAWEDPHGEVIAYIGRPKYLLGKSVWYGKDLADGADYLYITYWQPLPAPPKEGGKDEPYSPATFGDPLPPLTHKLEIDNNYD